MRKRRLTVGQWEYRIRKQALRPRGQPQALQEKNDVNG